MPDVLVCIPVLGRPLRAAPLLESLRASQRELELSPYFVASPGDEEELRALRRVSAPHWVVDWAPGRGDFARKTNAAFQNSLEPWFFAGADDLHFHPGWADEAVRVAEEYEVGMVGTNDLGNSAVMQGRHATHSLFRRSYIDECGGSADGPGVIYSEQYQHQYVDTEAYEVGESRGCFAFAAASFVEHLHPYWHKGQMDATYRKGLSPAAADRALYLQRRRLWT